MQSREPFELTLPPQAVANACFAFEAKLAAARRFLDERGIREVRPLYGSASRPRSGRSLVSAFDVRAAANDASRRDAAVTAA